MAQQEQDTIDELNRRISILYQARDFVQANDEKGSVPGIVRTIARYQGIIENLEDARGAARTAAKG